jgi:hypothetical protein
VWQIGGHYQGGISLAPAAALLDVTYIAHGTDLSNASAYTFTDASIGTADANRKVYVTIGWSQGVTLNSATIGGVSADIIVTASNGNRQSGIISAAVPTGTTGDVVLNFSGTSNRAIIDIYRVVNETGVVDFDSDVTFSTNTLSVGIDVTGTGAVIAAIAHQASNGAADCWVWTGATEQFDGEPELGYYYTSAFDFPLATETPRTVSAVTDSASPAAPAMSVVSITGS